MEGYYRRPDLTLMAVAGDWFRTGDIGMLDAQGYLYLKGRERDEINKGGVKIYPEDVDLVVEQHQAVEDVCTFAVDDLECGQDVGIAVVLAGGDALPLTDLYAWTAQRLAAHKVPGQWFVLDALPRTARGKVNRSAVAELCSNRQAVSPRPADLLSPRGQHR